MALWGNLDNKGSGGTVSLNYSTLVVTGSGTTFGQVGAAATGDVIRFGPRGEIGNAVIVGIASTTQLSIASTAGLSGVAIAAPLKPAVEAIESCVVLAIPTITASPK